MQNTEVKRSIMQTCCQGDYLWPRSFVSVLFYLAQLHFLEKSTLKKTLHFVKAHFDCSTLEEAFLALITPCLCNLSIIGVVEVTACRIVGLLHVKILYFIQQ